MQVNGKGSSGHQASPVTAAAVPSYIIDASPTGVYPADYEDLVRQARQRWLAVLEWQAAQPADNSAHV